MNDVRKVRKVGGSLAVTIPAQLCKKFNLQEGQPVELICKNGYLLVKPKPVKMPVKDRIALYKAQGLKPS